MLLISFRTPDNPFNDNFAKIDFARKKSKKSAPPRGDRSGFVQRKGDVLSTRIEAPNINFMDNVFVLFLSLKILFDLDRIVLPGGNAIKDPQPILVLHTKEADIALHWFVEIRTSQNF